MTVFLDTAFTVALVSRQDQLHARATEWLRRNDAAVSLFVTTQAVLLEIGNALSRLRFRAKAAEILASMDNDPRFDVIRITPELYAAGFNLFRSRSDKEWGLVDCLSFIVMSERGISEALTADEHFEQAGVRALLRESA